MQQLPITIDIDYIQNMRRIYGRKEADRILEVYHQNLKENRIFDRVALRQKIDKIVRFKKRQKGLCIRANCSDIISTKSIAFCEKHIKINSQLKEKLKHIQRERQQSGLCTYLKCTEMIVSPKNKFCERHNKRKIEKMQVMIQ